jgi:hypothetical protein
MTGGVAGRPDSDAPVVLDTYLFRWLHTSCSTPIRVWLQARTTQRQKSTRQEAAVSRSSPRREPARDVVRRPAQKPWRRRSDIRAYRHGSTAAVMTMPARVRASMKGSIQVGDCWEAPHPAALKPPWAAPLVTGQRQNQWATRVLHIPDNSFRCRHAHPTATRSLC